MSKIKCDWNKLASETGPGFSGHRPACFQSLYSNYTQSWLLWSTFTFKSSWDFSKRDIFFLVTAFFYFFGEQTSKNLKTCTFTRPVKQRRRTLSNLCSHEHLSSHSHSKITSVVFNIEWSLHRAPTHWKPPAFPWNTLNYDSWFKHFHFSFQAFHWCFCRSSNNPQRSSYTTSVPCCRPDWWSLFVTDGRKQQVFKQHRNQQLLNSQKHFKIR